MPIPDPDWDDRLYVSVQGGQANPVSMQDLEDLATMFPTFAHMSESDDLLQEWAYWWASTDAEPKLPKALQVRTALYFHKRTLEPSDAPLPDDEEGWDDGT